MRRVSLGALWALATLAGLYLGLFTGGIGGFFLTLAIWVTLGRGQASASRDVWWYVALGLAIPAGVAVGSLIMAGLQGLVLEQLVGVPRRWLRLTVGGAAAGAGVFVLVAGALLLAGRPMAGAALLLGVSAVGLGVGIGQEAALGGRLRFPAVWSVVWALAFDLPFASGFLGPIGGAALLGTSTPASGSDLLGPVLGSVAPVAIATGVGIALLLRISIRDPHAADEV
jgi:hypothetical protein